MKETGRRDLSDVMPQQPHRQGTVKNNAKVTDPVTRLNDGVPKSD